jgi:hypothetical protein
MMAPISPQVPTPSNVVEVEPAGIDAEHTASGGPFDTASLEQPQMHNR